MTHVHYKFSSKLSYDTVVCDGPNFTLMELKRQIMEREKLRVGYCDLQITNAQTKQEYESDHDLIPKGTSVIVRRIPIAGVKLGLNCSKTFSIDSSDVPQLHHLPGADKPMDYKSSSKEALFFSEIANLAHADVPEEEKLQVVLNQSSLDSVNYKFGNNLPASYTCYRCGNTGHHIRNCPNSKEKTSETPLKVKKSTGIPRSFMVEVDDPTLKGAMLTNCGRYAIPTIDAEAYAIGKKEKPAFVSEELLEPEDEEDPVPDELLCLICRDLLNDAVVIPCCGNSYCDDCIRTALLDSEEHVCPTCSQSDVSPDTLIANKFLRQAVNTFKREQGKSKTLGKGCAASQSKNPTPTLSPTPTPPPLFTQIQPQKIKQPVQSPQDPVRPCSPAEVTNTQPLSQESETPPIAAGPASPSNSPSRSLQTEQVNLDLTEFDSGSAHAEVKKQDESAAAASPSGHVTISLDHPSSQLEPSFDQTQSDQQKSSSGSWSKSKPQPPPPSSSSSSYPTPPPLFPPPHLLPFQPLSGYPPGYPPATPVWTFPTLKGAPIPPLPSTSSIPALMSNDWYMHHRRRRERSPHRGSTYSHSSKSSKSKSSHSYHSSRSKSRFRSKDRSRSSHRGSTNSRSSQSSKSKSSYSHPSSRSRSRSRSKSRLRPHSSSSRHRDHHSSSHFPKTYSYGYKRLRSPTTSSSSSPRAGYHSRHESSSDHRHHRKKSSTSSSRFRRGGDHYHKEEGVSAAYVYPQYADQMSSLELDRQRYLQWKREYKDWCEKYLDSYLEHFHQLPPLPPCPFPAGNGRERHRKRSNSRGRHHSRQTSRTHRRSPPSRSSSDSRSLSSQSSSSSSTKSSHSSRYSSSSSSGSSTDIRSPHSQRLSDSRSPQPEQDSSRPNPFREQNEEEELKERSQDDKQLGEKNLEDLSNLKLKRADLNEHKQRREKETSPHDAADLMDTSGKNKSHNKVPNPCNDASSKEKEVALYSAKQQTEPDKGLKKDYRQKNCDIEDKDGEKQKKRDKYPDTRKDSDRRHKDRSSQRKHRVDEDKYKDHKSSESRSEKSRKRKEEMERRSDKADSSKWQKIKTKVDLESRRVEPQFPFEGKKRKSEKYEKKIQPLSGKDVWEEGIKVKAQKKISINIKIDTKKIEETQNTIEEKTEGGEIERVNKGEAEAEKDINKDSCGDEEEVKMKAEREAKQIWLIKNFRDGKAEMSESSSGEKTDVRSKREESEYEELDKWSCGDDEDKSKNLPADTMESQREEVANTDWRAVIKEKEEERGVRGDFEGQEMGGRGSGDEEERHEKEDPGNENTGNLLVVLEPKEEEEREKEMHERDASVPTSQRSRSESDHDGLETNMDDISHDDCKERKMVVKTLEEYTENRTADEDKLVLIQVPLSKWEKSEDEELQPLPPVSVTAGTTSIKEPEPENEHQRQRSVEKERDRSTERGGGRDREKNSHRSLAPSSGKYRHDSTSCSGRERRRESHRESMKSKERTREEDRSREKEKRRDHHPFSNSHSYPRLCDVDRRERHREEKKKSSSAPSENYSGGKGRDTKQPDGNSLKTDRNMLPDSKSKVKDRPRHSWEREELSSTSSRESEISKSRSSSPGRESKQSRSRDETKVQMHNVNKDRREHEGWRPTEKEERDEKMRRKCGLTDCAKRIKMEDAEWPSSNSSSSSRDSSRDFRRAREETRK